MLRLSKIVKTYQVADMNVEALKGIDLAFRKNEFVAILGPSGCGKTTMLNIIGGLDKYTSGDLCIAGKSTKEFTGSDWDLYRNHRIGFVFQSYNLIPHQTILGNVELALTIAGLSKEERVARAKKAIDRVGLEGQYRKRPNQLSGGQCQRVAIARALVNEPDILLADEPTGALDTQTSIQIMDLIKEISQEKLVIMVTHNPDLATQYANRIVRLIDGTLLSDSNPFSVEEETEEVRRTEAEVETEETKKKHKAKMSFWTAFKLSARNLFTKKGRTIMTCIAGSIGIIGVSMVLAVSSGVKGYINSMQDDMLSGNPIMIAEEAYDLSAFMGQMSTGEKLDVVQGKVNVSSLIAYMAEKFTGDNSFVTKNTITKEYIDYIKQMPAEYANAIAFNYGINIDTNIYTDFKLDANSVSESISLTALLQMYTSVMEETDFGSYASMIQMLGNPLSQSIPNKDYLLSQYNLLGDSKIATEKNEIMLVIDKDSTVVDLSMARLGYYTQEEFMDLAINYNNPDATLKKRFTYEEILSKTFMYYPNDTIYVDKSSIAGDVAPFEYVAYSKDFDKSEGLELKVVGILQPKEDISFGALSSGFYYTEALSEYAIASSLESQIIAYANAHADEDGNFSFGVRENGVNMKYVVPYRYHYTTIDGETKEHAGVLTSKTSSMMSGMMGGGSSTDTFGPSIRELGGKSIPNGVKIYPLSFEEKDLVTKYLDAWNEEGTIVVGNQSLELADRFSVKYTDSLELIISLINGMIDIVTTALIAFTALSLVVSCVMIAIITYVSVVERIKEIGVIRSLGGRKKDVSHLFNAETFIIGLASGVFGVTITYILSLIINLIVQAVSGIQSICALPVSQAIIMIVVSVLLTCISGLVPAKSAAKKDPVVALRTE